MDLLADTRTVTQAVREAVDDLCFLLDFFVFVYSNFTFHLEHFIKRLAALPSCANQLTDL